MIIPDINLLVYAYNADVPQHPRAKAWWEDLLDGGSEPVGLAWLVILGFTRLMTHPAVVERPLAPHIALGHVREWLARAQVQIVQPGPRHLDVLTHLFALAGAGGNLTTDVHLAALAIEHQCELHSSDLDFARFSGLRWRNPLSPPAP